MKYFQQNSSKNYNKLAGWWSDDCPVEFSYEELESFKKQPSTEFGNKFTSADGQLYGEITQQRSKIIIQIYRKPDIYITQIEIDGFQSNLEQIRFTSQYLIYISEESMYYYNLKIHQGFSFMFQNPFYLQFCYSQNQLQVIIKNQQQRIDLYRIQENFEIKLVKQVDGKNYFYGSVNEHILGFFVKDFDKIHLLSNKTLKKLCSFKILNVDDTCSLIKWHLMKNILILQVKQKKYKIMTHLRNGKIIRKIKCRGVMESFSHFLIVSKRKNILENSLNIFDYTKGAFVAKIQYPKYKHFIPAYIQDNKLIIKMEMYDTEWNIKQQIQ